MIEVTVARAAATRLVAVQAGEIVGSVLLFLPGSDAGYRNQAGADTGAPEIRYLAVDPTFRNNGVARTLMAAIIEIARVNGYNTIGLHTIFFMRAARSLYAALGFQRYEAGDFRIPGGLLIEAYRLRLGGDLSLGPKSRWG
jgi:GNAT superfamily N-acetyltransferase